MNQAKKNGGHKFANTIVIALGGSVMYPDSLDAAFLKRFRDFVKRFLKKKKKFVIVTGGGRLSRLYQHAAGKIEKVTNEDKDWIGIHATRLNAHLLRTIFRDVADPVVVDSRYKIKDLRHPITIASGWRPGWSTDYIAVALAEDFGAREVVVAGKPAYVYDKDHAKHDDAVPIEKLSWREYRRLIPKKWKPGLHTPVDPVAAGLADKKGITAIIVNGRDLKNVENLLNGKPFRGSIIQ